MKLATLKSAERALWRLQEVYKAEDKTCGLAHVKFEAAYKLWREAYQLVRDREIQMARTKDKGKVLFTIFVPMKSYTLEAVRTPNLIITRHLWNDSWAPGGSRPSEPYIEVCSKLYPPDYHRDYYLHKYQEMMEPKKEVLV